jgi:hypothetical protein
MTRVQPMDLAASLSYTAPLVLPGFRYDPEPYGGLSFRFFRPTDPAEAFVGFTERVISAVGKAYLPVYRMADGEFAFMVGERRDATDVADARSRLRARAGALYRRLRGGMQTCWGERYSRTELERGRARFETSLRQVGAQGIIAPYFAVRADGWGSAYFGPVTTWLEQRGIPLHAGNYVPFYFVYALLRGVDSVALLTGRRVLVATHLTAERKSAIEVSLMAAGAASVAWLPLSAQKALLDDIDIGPHAGRADIALVAAGIGSVSVLAQMQPLGIPCIDCGIALEAMIDRTRARERPFLESATESGVRTSRAF